MDKFDPLKKGVDVGGGGDTTEICTRQGGLVGPFKTKDEEDTMKTAAWIEADIIEDEPDEVCLDNVGLGRGVYDRLRDFGRKIRGINVRNTAFDSRKFFQMRDELCWRLRAEFEQGSIAIPNDDELMEQLSQPGFELNSSGQIVVESKKKMKAKGMPSPNKFDALMLTYFTNDKSYRQNKMDETDEYEKAFKRKEGRGGDFSWLGA